MYIYIYVYESVNSSKPLSCSSKDVPFDAFEAVDAVRQAERLASQWQKRAEQAETTKEEIKENESEIQIWVFPKIGVPPKWMVYNGNPY